jgi:hypothetical protein
MDPEYLLKALNNNNNEYVFELTSQKIIKIKQKILETIPLNKNQKKVLEEKLKNYIYIDSVNKLKLGSYVRWLNKDEEELNKGAFLSSVYISNDNIHIVLKNFNKSLFTLNFYDVILFQKLSQQENVLLEALDILKK